MPCPLDDTQLGVAASGLDELARLGDGHHGIVAAMHDHQVPRRDRRDGAQRVEGLDLGHQPLGGDGRCILDHPGQLADRGEAVWSTAPRRQISRRGHGDHATDPLVLGGDLEAQRPTEAEPRQRRHRGGIDEGADHRPQVVEPPPGGEGPPGLANASQRRHHRRPADLAGDALGELWEETTGEDATTPIEGQAMGQDDEPTRRVGRRRGRHLHLDGTVRSLDPCRVERHGSASRTAQMPSCVARISRWYAGSPRKSSEDLARLKYRCA